MVEISTTTVGRSYGRLEGRAKVTGRADYIYNLRLPSMLHAKVYRSPVAHGRIKSINIEEAVALPGVHMVVTGEDVKTVLPEPYYGPAFHDQPILARSIGYVTSANRLLLAWPATRILRNGQRG